MTIKLKVGFLVDDLTTNQYVYDLARHVSDYHHFHANSNFAVVDFNRDVSFMRTNCKILTDTFKAISLLLLGKN
ncbi:MAG: hypothetical protein QF864_11890 [SAR202 cluster bacterium]|jgi:hypothetical protein|nr:hypothetical protein [SAR202 cluster bacterium]|tara:strand:- start:92 stop:313 length:222 start_codon:yes stop_codon:yes gene_type:complete